MVEDSSPETSLPTFGEAGGGEDVQPLTGTEGNAHEEVDEAAQQPPQSHSSPVQDGDESSPVQDGDESSTLMEKADAGEAQGAGEVVDDGVELREPHGDEKDPGNVSAVNI